MKKFVFDILDWTTEGGDDPDQFFGRIIFVGIMSIFAFLFFGSIIHGFFDMIRRLEYLYGG